VTDIGPAELLRVLEALGWPRMRFGSLVLEGEAAWRSVSPQAHERLDIMHRLGRRELLSVTPVGRRRLRAWLDRRKASPPPTPRPWRITRLRFFGDEEMLPALAGALDANPAPVADFAVDECMVAGTGRSTSGFTTGPLPLLRPIVLCGALHDADLARTFLHEVAHQWTLEDMPPAPTAVAIVQARQINAANNWDCSADIQHGEDVADWLAFAWGAR